MAIVPPIKSFRPITEISRMPLPIAHACIGASVATAAARCLSAKNATRLQIAGAVLAIVPDFDFFFVWVLGMAGWHRAFAHSIAFSVAVAAVVALAFGTDWRRALPVLSAAMASHGLLDYLTSRLAPGPALLWPFSSRRYGAGLIDYLDFSIRVRNPFEFLVLIVEVSMVEALVFIPAFLAMRLVVNKLGSAKGREVAINQETV